MVGMKPGIGYRGVPEGQIVVEDNRTAEHWVLAMVGEFALFQTSVSAILEHLVAARGLSNLASELSKRHLRRLTDDERWAYYKAMLRDVGCEDRLQEASDVFWQVKRTRDAVAHSARLSLLLDPELGIYRYFVDPAYDKGLPFPLTPTTMRLMIVQCGWLKEVAYFAARRAGVRVFEPYGHQHEDGSTHRTEVVTTDPGPAPRTPDWVLPEGRPLPCGPGCRLGAVSFDPGQ